MFIINKIFPLLTIADKLLNYERKIRSLLLITINAMPIADTTTPPAIKLDMKFANEVVIYNSVFINKN